MGRHQPGLLHLDSRQYASPLVIRKDVQGNNQETDIGRILAEPTARPCASHTRYQRDRSESPHTFGSTRSEAGHPVGVVLDERAVERSIAHLRPSVRPRDYEWIVSTEVRLRGEATPRVRALGWDSGTRHAGSISVPTETSGLRGIAA